MVLAVISHLLTRHGELSVPALVNLLISLSLIALTSYLALQTKSAHAAVEERAALIDLTHDTISSGTFRARSGSGTAAPRSSTDGSGRR